MEYREELKPKISNSGFMLRCFDRYTGRKIILKISYIESAEEWLDNVLCIKKDNGVWFDFKTNKYGSLEELVRLTLKLEDISQAKDFIKDKYRVLFVLDDRNQVVDMWRDIGLTCLQVADGNF